MGVMGETIERRKRLAELVAGGSGEAPALLPRYSDNRSDERHRRLFARVTGIETSFQAAPPEAAVLPPEPSAIGQVLGSVVRGAGELAASPVMAYAGARRVAGDVLEAMPGTLLDPLAAEERRHAAMAEAGVQALRGALPESQPHYQDSFWMRDLPEAAGQFAALLGTFMVSPIAGTTTAVLGGAGQQYEDTRGGGGSAAAQAASLPVGAAIGALDILPIKWFGPLGTMFTRWKSLGGTGSSAALLRISISGGAEASQEAAQGVLQTLAHNYMTDDDRALLEGVASEAGAGGILGTAMRALVEGVLARRRVTGRAQAAGGGFTGPEDPFDDGTISADAHRTPPDPELHADRVEQGAGWLLAEMAKLPEGSLSGPEDVLRSDLAAVAVSEIGMDPSEAHEAAGMALEQRMAAIRGIQANWEEAHRESVARREEARRVAREALGPPEPVGEVGPEGALYAPAKSAPMSAWQERVARARGTRLSPARPYAHAPVPAPEVPAIPAQQGARGAQAQAVAAVRAQTVAERLGEPYANPLANTPSGTARIDPATRRPTPLVWIDDGPHTPGNAARGGNDVYAGTNHDTYGARGVMDRPSVIDSIRAAGETVAPMPVFQTPLLPEGMSAAHLTKTGAVVMRRWGDFRSAAHELGHHLSAKLLAIHSQMNPGGTPLPVAVDAELNALGMALYGPTGIVPNGGYREEGIAEFVWHWLGNHEQLGALAPETMRWFETTVLAREAALKGALLDARERMDAWRFQGSEKRARSQVAFVKGPLARLADSLKRSLHWTRIVEEWVGRTLVFKQIDERLRKMRLPSNIEAEALSLAGQADARLTHALEHGTQDINYEHTGPGLRAETVEMHGHQDDLGLYLAVKRMIVRPQESGTAVVDAENTARALEAKYGDRIVHAAAGYYRWRDRMLDYLGQCDPVFGHALEVLRGEYAGMGRPADDATWIPLQRVIERLDDAVFRSFGGLDGAREGKLARESTPAGSPLPVKDPWATLGLEFRRMLEVAHHRTIITELVRAADAAPDFLADEVLEVTGLAQGEFQGPSGSVAQPGVSREIDMGSAFSVWMNPPEWTGRAFRYTIAELAGGTNALGVPTYRVREFLVSPRVYTALQHLSPQQLKFGGAMLTTLLRASKTVLTLGATVLFPDFLVLNAVRDPTTLYLASRHNPSFVPMMAGVLYEHMRVAAASLPGLRKVLPYHWNDIFEQLHVLPGGHISSELGSRARVDLALSNRLQRQVSFVTSMHGVETVAKFVGWTDRAPRIWEMKQTARKIGWSPVKADGSLNTMTREVARELIVDGRRSTVNNFEGGRVATAVNAFVPFFNVQFQGPRGIVRRLKADPLSTAFRILALMAFATLNWARNKYGEDNEETGWFDSLPLRERFANNWFPFTASDGTRQLLRMPMTPDVAFFTKSLEFALEGLAEQDWEAPKGFVREAVRNLTPVPIPPLFAEIVEQFANVRDISATIGMEERVPIEPQYVAQTVPAPERTNRYSSRVAIALGKAMPEFLPISPLRFDHAISGLAAGGGRALADLGMSTRGIDEPANVSLTGVLFRRGGQFTMRSEPLSKLGDLYDAAMVAQNSKLHPETSEQEYLRLAITDAKVAVEAIAYMRAIHAKTPKEREVLAMEANKIARDAIALVQEGKLTRADFYGTRRRVEFQRKRLDIQAGVKTP